MENNMNMNMHKKHSRITDNEKKTVWTKIHLDGMKIRDVRDEMGIAFGSVQRFSYGDGASYARSLVYGYEARELDELYVAVNNRAIIENFKSYVAEIPEAGLLSKDEFENLFVIFLTNIQKSPELVELKEKINERIRLLRPTKYPCGRKRRMLANTKTTDSHVETQPAIVTPAEEVEETEEEEETPTTKDSSNGVNNAYTWKNAWNRQA